MVTAHKPRCAQRSYPQELQLACTLGMEVVHLSQSDLSPLSRTWYTSSIGCLILSEPGFGFPSTDMRAASSETKASETWPERNRRARPANALMAASVYVGSTVGPCSVRVVTRWLRGLPSFNDVFVKVPQENTPPDLFPQADPAVTDCPASGAFLAAILILEVGEVKHDAPKNIRV